MEIRSKIKWLSVTSAPQELTKSCLLFNHKRWSNFKPKFRLTRSHRIETLFFSSQKNHPLKEKFQSVVSSRQAEIKNKINIKKLRIPAAGLFHKNFRKTLLSCCCKWFSLQWSTMILWLDYRLWEEAQTEPDCVSWAALKLWRDVSKDVCSVLASNKEQRRRSKTKRETFYLFSVFIWYHQTGKVWDSTSLLWNYSLTDLCDRLM